MRGSAAFIGVRSMKNNKACFVFRSGSQQTALNQRSTGSVDRAYD